MTELPQRSAARIAAYAVGFWAFFTLIFIGIQQVQFPGYSQEGAYVGAIIVIAISLTAIRWLLRRDDLSFADVGLSVSSKCLRHFIIGVVVGVALVAVMVAATLLLTPIEFSATPDRQVLSVIVLSFVVFSLLSLMEEVAFRSYLLFRLREAWGIRPAVYVTSIVFAFYHGLAFENLLGPGIWGLTFAWMALATKSIALPTGFHMGVNWLPALFGTKPRYSDSLWEFSVGTDAGYMSADTLSLVFQVALLVVGVGLVEHYIAKQKNGAASALEE